LVELELGNQRAFKLVDCGWDRCGSSHVFWPSFRGWTKKMSGFALVHDPQIPIRELGYLAGPRRPVRRRMQQTVTAPEIPLYQLGFLGADLGVSAAQIVGASGPFAAIGVTKLLAATSWAGPIGAAVGVAVGLIGGLLAAHAVRAKQARNENQAMNAGVQGFDQGLQQIKQAYAAGKATDGTPVDLNTAMQAAQLLLANYWTEVEQQIQPGRNGCSSGASCPPAPASGNPCTGSIGAACCVGCYDLEPSINGPKGVLAALQGLSSSTSGVMTAEILHVFGSKYGGIDRPAYTITFTPPPAAQIQPIGPAIPPVPGQNVVSSGQNFYQPSTPTTPASGSIWPWLIAAGIGFALLS
jgi:hypothetical protein